MRKEGREEEEGKEHIGFYIHSALQQTHPPISLWGVDMVVPLRLLVHGDKGRKGQGGQKEEGDRFYYCVRLKGQLSHIHTHTHTHTLEGSV